MKKFYLASTLLALVATFACSQADDSNEVAVPKAEISIGLPIGVSRTAVDNEGHASWVEGDTFTLWAENRTGGFDLNGADFTMMYYWHSIQSAVFTSFSPALTEGDYTYYAVSPKPENVDSRKANYTLPAEQQGYPFSGAYDVMVATPVTANALSGEKLNNLALEFNHKMHLLKLMIPKNANPMSHPIRSVVFTFPRAVTGNITVDATDPSAAIAVNSSSKKLTVNVQNGFDEGKEAWGVILPGEIAGEVSYYAVSTIGQPTAVRTFSLAKECLSGHITPLSLTIPTPLPPTIYFSIGTNHLGEAIQKFTIYDNLGAAVVSHNVNSTNSYDLNKNSFFTIDKIAEYRGKTFTVYFESANAIVSKQFTMPSNIDGFENSVIPAVDVPYLFFEDFTNIHTSFEKDDARVSNLMEADGMLLNDYMYVSGWNGAHIKGVAGQSVRVNVRHQSTMGVTRSNGRLDSPSMKGLKAGASVKLKVEFDMGAYVDSGYDSNNGVFCIAGIHYNGEGSVLNGVVSTKAFGNVSDDASRVSGQFSSVCLQTGDLSADYNNDSFSSSFPTYSYTANNCSSTTRLCWIPCCKQSTYITANNAHYYLYIDNVRVSIAQ